MIGTTLKQRFFLERELGRGGMGAVYRAVDQVLQRPVAIKVLRDLRGEEVGRRLRLEAQILARLLHEQIVRLYDFDEENGTFYFIMEEVDGESYYRRRKALSLAEAARGPGPDRPRRSTTRTARGSSTATSSPATSC